MSRMVNVLLCVTFVVAAIATVGCGGNGNPSAQGEGQGGGNGNPSVQGEAQGGGSASADDLRELEMAYLSYQGANQQGPPGWDELLRFASESNLNSVAIERVHGAGYQVKWNVKLDDVAEGLSEFVLAEPTSGGPKLMLDGSVQE
jgi:hypothetical protein